MNTTAVGVLIYSAIDKSTAISWLKYYSWNIYTMKLRDETIYISCEYPIHLRHILHVVLRKSLSLKIVTSGKIL